MAFLSLRPGAKANIYEMMQHNEGCDLTVKTAGFLDSDCHSYRIHEIVWKSIIKKSWDMVNGVFIFKFSAEILREMIEFAYTGKFKLTEENFSETVAASSFYGIVQLHGLCQQFSMMKEKENSETHQVILAVGGWAERPTSLTESFDMSSNSSTNWVSNLGDEENLN